MYGAKKSPTKKHAGKSPAKKYGGKTPAMKKCKQLKKKIQTWLV
jgi:hypothetical protein